MTLKGMAPVEDQQKGQSVEPRPPVVVGCDCSRSPLINGFIFAMVYMSAACLLASCVHTEIPVPNMEVFMLMGLAIAVGAGVISA